MTKKKQLRFFDTTLRDGSQAEGISFSLQDKVRIARLLDDWGMDYIEGGWPGSNPKDISFFKEMQNIKLKYAKLAAFGSTAHPKNKAADDANLIALIDSKTPVCTIFGKSWDLHVQEALKISLSKNLQIIEDSVRFLKSKGREVIFDAEHFFDGYKENPKYALQALEAAMNGGADNLTLADTNGGALTSEISEISAQVRSLFPDIELGIHCHNDGGMAVANTIAHVQQGGILVQGTINGIGERCGNADLISILPNLLIKLGYDAKIKKKMDQLTLVSRKIAELANMVFNSRAPFVGHSAFAHKGGIHVSAVNRNPKTYEHIEPDIVGNTRRVLVSELAGKSNLVFKSKELNIDLDQHGDKGKEIVKQIKEQENQGYHYEGAEASLELLVKKILGTYEPFFALRGYRAIIERHPERAFDGDCPEEKNIANSFETWCEASIKLLVSNNEEHTVASGNGPVQALDRALRKALIQYYPHIQDVSINDYKVRVIDENEGTGSKVRVLIDHRKGDKIWSTIGVHENIITASWLALVDGVEYFLFKHKMKAKDF